MLLVVRDELKSFRTILFAGFIAHPTTTSKLMTSDEIQKIISGELLEEKFNNWYGTTLAPSELCSL